MKIKYKEEYKRNIILTMETINFEELRKKMKNDYLTKLIDYMNNEKKEKSSNTLYDNEIAKILELIKHTNSDILEDNQIDEISKKASISIYKKPWKYLTREQKITKLNKYVDENYKDVENKKIKKFLMDNIDNKKMNTKKAISYDEENCIIKNIHLLSELK